MGAENGVEPRKPYSGKFYVRVPSDPHADLAITAAEGKSLNHWIADVLKQAVHDEARVSPNSDRRFRRLGVSR